MAVVTAINTFTLRDGVTHEQFDAFSRDVDRPACLAQDVVESFDVYFVEPNESTGIDVIEVMTVTSWAEWESVRDTAPALAPVAHRFEQLVDMSSVSTYLTHRSHLNGSD